MKLALITFFTAFLVSNVYAQQVRYISDVLYVPLRSGKGSQFRIINRGLSSGTKLTLIEADAAGEWSLVATDRGVQGWIRNQYLQTQPVATARLKRSEKKITDLEKLRLQLRKQIKELQAKNQELSATLTSSNQQGEELGQQLEGIKKISANAVDIHQRHQVLMKNHQLLQTELDVMKSENSRLADKSRHTWFLYGAGAVGLGVLIALLVPALRPRNRSSEWG